MSETIPGTVMTNRLTPAEGSVELNHDQGWGVSDWLLLAALVALALPLRLDRFMTVPAFTDESMEVLLALDTLAAGRLNLVGVSSFLGGFHTWLLMAVTIATGGWPAGPRLLSLLAGVVTVLLTALLGRELGGRWAGLLAGGLLATNLAHIVISSRIAWSNCVTPLFITGALLLLSRALVRDRPRLLPAAGLFVGLAVQTHPSAAAIVPGIALGVVATAAGRRWLWTPWPWLGGLAALLAYANVLWFNLLTGGRSLAAAQERDYAVRPASGPAEAMTNLVDLLRQLVGNIGSFFSEGRAEPAIWQLGLVVLLIGLAGLGLITLGGRGQWLLPVVLLVSPVLMGLVGGEYQPLPHSSSRYLGSLWPVIFSLVGLGASRLLTMPAVPETGLSTLAPRPWRRRAAWVAIALLLIMPPVATTYSYLGWYSQRPIIGPFNLFVLQVGELTTTRFPRQRIYLDTSLHGDDSSDAGTLHRSLSMVLRLQGNLPVSTRRNQRQTSSEIVELLGAPSGGVILRRDRVAALRREGALLTAVGEAVRVVDPELGEVRLYEFRAPVAR